MPNERLRQEIQTAYDILFREMTVPKRRISFSDTREVLIVGANGEIADRISFIDLDALPEYRGES